MRTRPRGSASASRTSSTRRSCGKRSRSRSRRRTLARARLRDEPLELRRARRALTESCARAAAPVHRRHLAARRRALKDGQRCSSKARRAPSSTSTTARILSSPPRTRSPARRRPGSASARRGSTSVIGVAKAYVTRVGEGPFPTEIEGPDQERVRELGAEYGTTTGRERRCGWLDLVGLRFAARVNGMTSLALTKLDVLSTFEEIPVCVRYRLPDGSETRRVPRAPERLPPRPACLRGLARLAGGTRRRPAALRPALRRVRRAGPRARGVHDRHGRRPRAGGRSARPGRHRLSRRPTAR